MTLYQNCLKSSASLRYIASRAKYRKIKHKQLLLKNLCIDFQITSQKCSLHDPRPKCLYWPLLCKKCPKSPQPQVSDIEPYCLLVLFSHHDRSCSMTISFILFYSILLHLFSVYSMSVVGFELCGCKAYFIPSDFEYMTLIVC